MPHEGDESVRNGTGERQIQRRGFVIECLDTPPEQRPYGKAPRAGCGATFGVWVMVDRGSWACPACGKRQRAKVSDDRSKCSAAVKDGPIWNRDALKAAVR